MARKFYSLRLAEIVGHAEMVKNGGMWRKRIRGGPAEIRALKHTIEDYKLRTPDQRFQIRDRPAWFTDRYLRNLVEIDEAERAKNESKERSATGCSV